MATIKKQNKNKNDGTIYHHEVADLQAQLRELNQRLAAVTSYQQQQQSSNISNNNENKRKKTNNIRSNYQPPPPPPPSVPLPSKTKTKCFVPQSKPKEITVAKPIWGNPHHPPPPPPAKNLCQKVKKQQPKPPPPPSLPHLQQNNKMTAQTPLSPSARHSAGTKFTISTWKSPPPLSMTKPKPKPSIKAKGKITDDTSKSSKSNSSSTTTTTKKKTVRRVVRRPNTSRQASVGPKVLSDIKNCNCAPSSLKHTITKDRATVMSTIRHRWYMFLPVTTPAAKALPPTRGTRMTTSSSAAAAAAATRVKHNAPQTKPLPPPRNNKTIPGKIAVSGPNKATWSIPKQKLTNNGVTKQQNENEKETMVKIMSTTNASNSRNVVDSRPKRAKPRAPTPNIPPKKVDGYPTLAWMSKRLKPVPTPQPGTKAPPTARGSVPAGTKTSPLKSEPPKKIMHTKSAMPVRPKPQNLLADIRKEGTTKSILKSTNNMNNNQRLNQTHASKASLFGSANALSSTTAPTPRPQTLQEQLAAKVTSRVSKNVPSFSNKPNEQTKSLPVSTMSKGNCPAKNSQKLAPAGIDNGKTKKWNKTVTSPVSAAKVKASVMNASARPPPRLNLLAEIQNNNLELKPTQPKEEQTTKHIARTAAENNDHPCNNKNYENTGNKMMTSNNDLLAGIRAGVELKMIVDTPPPGQQKENSGINRNGKGGGHTSIMADIKAGVSLKKVAPPVEHDKSKKPPPNSLLAQLQARKEECLKRNKASYIDDSDDDDW